MNNLYVNPATSLYQQFAGQTGLTYFPRRSWPRILVTPPICQPHHRPDDPGRGVGRRHPERTQRDSGAGVAGGKALGTAAGNAAIATNNASGSKTAMVATLTPYVPPNAGQPGVYVPPGGRPALQPTWGSVGPLGMTTPTITAVEQSVPVHNR